MRQAKDLADAYKRSKRERGESDEALLEDLEQITQDKRVPKYAQTLAKGLLEVLRRVNI